MEEFYQLINKKLTGEISAYEEIKLRKWIDSSAENELLYRRMVDVWNEGRYKIRIKGQQTTFRKISEKLDLEEDILHEQITTRSQKKWKIWYRAAVIILFMAVGAGIFYLRTISPDSIQAVEQTEMVLKKNPAGQKTRIHLPDGSVCWLNSESEIRFLSNFSDSTRNIYLTGEAYFEVAKDPDKPFKVHTPDMIVTALGTVFNVTSFPEDKKETVALIEGKISVVCRDNFYKEVLPGEGVSFNRLSASSGKIMIDPAEAIAWKDGILIFNDETYKTIFSKLERWYGVKITVTGTPPAGLKYRATFRNELLVNILESIRYGRDFDFEINGKNVKIMFN